jgi:hypothetical protein
MLRYTCIVLRVLLSRKPWDLRKDRAWRKMRTFGCIYSSCFKRFSNVKFPLFLFEFQHTFEYVVSQNFLSLSLNFTFHEKSFLRFSSCSMRTDSSRPIFTPCIVNAPQPVSHYWLLIHLYFSTWPTNSIMWLHQDNFIRCAVFYSHLLIWYSAWNFSALLFVPPCSSIPISLTLTNNTCNKHFVTHSAMGVSFMGEIWLVGAECDCSALGWKCTCLWCLTLY